MNNMNKLYERYQNKWARTLSSTTLNAFVELQLFFQNRGDILVYYYIIRVFIHGQVYAYILDVTNPESKSSIFRNIPETQIESIFQARVKEGMIVGAQHNYNMAQAVKKIEQLTNNDKANAIIKFYYANSLENQSLINKLETNNI